MRACDLTVKEEGQFCPTVGMWPFLLAVLLKSTMCIPGGRHGRSKAGGQRARLLCLAASRGSELGWVEQGAGIRLRF